MKKLFVGAAAAVTLLGGAANAATTTFTFQNPNADLPDVGLSGAYTTTNKCIGLNVTSGDICAIDPVTGDATQLTYVDGSLQVEVTATNNLSSDAALLQDVKPNNSGLAVLSEGEESFEDQVQLETGEAIKFVFNTEVYLNGIDFNAGKDRNCSPDPGNEGPCGYFELLVDGVSKGTFMADDDLTDSVWGVLRGTMFEIVARGMNGDPLGGAVGFAIGSITVSEVPLPGAAIFLLSGLAGLGFARSRKSA